jgi:hypothetical protein
MFPTNANSMRRKMTLQEVIDIVSASTTIFCLNPSHKPTCDVAIKLGIPIVIPEKPPIVKLDVHDHIIVMSVRGLPRLTDRHEYTQDEIAQAEFEYGMWSVMEPLNMESGV